MDGVKIKELLINSYGFKAEDIELWKEANDGGPGFLIDAAKIREKLCQLIEISQPGDTLIFYFSGHGNYDEEGHIHLVAADGSALYGNFYNTSHAYINFIYLWLSMHGYVNSFNLLRDMCRL